MKKFAMLLGDDVESLSHYAVPADVTGVLSSRLMSPPEYPLWLCVSSLEAGATITWDDDHGDEGIYVLEGELEVAGQQCQAGGAVIVESGVRTQATASGASRIVHCGSWDPQPPTDGPFGPVDPDGHGVHVVGPQGWFSSGSEDGVLATWYADATCPTCRISMFKVARDVEGPSGGRPHTHTADEIIYILDGSMRLGSYELGPDSSLCIPGNVRYAQSAGSNGCTFLNFRRDTSDQVYFEKGIEPVPLRETGIARGGVEVGDVVHLVMS